MPAKARRKPIDAEKYLRLIAASLPIPPRSEAEKDRLVELLSGMDEREDLSPEEEAFAELLAIVIEDFENKHYALPAVAPHEALKSLMQDRKISAALAKRLAAHLRVPVELFV
jgi:antitoxin component HigA of HigAB toxin-antitoxin module